MQLLISPEGRTQTAAVIAARGGFCLGRTPGALRKAVFIDQGLTPGNINIHPQASFSRKSINNRVHRLR